MRGKRVVREQTHLGSSSKKKTVKDGRGKGTPRNVVFIDLDDDSVIIIDPEESSKQRFESSSVHGEGIINIDDDDEDTDVDPGISVEGDGDLVSDASSSKSQFPPFKTMRKSVHSDTDECRVVREKTSAFQFSKCKQTYGTKATGRNRYGLDPASDNGSTDSDCSDCEVMEDSLLREQWKRASVSLKRKKRERSHHSGLEDQASASGSNGEARTNAEEESGTEQQQVPVRSSSSNADNGKENVSDFVTNDGGYAETTASKPPSDGSCMDADQKAEQESCPYWKPTSVQETEFLHRNADFQCGAGTTAGDPRCSLNCQSRDDFFDDIPVSVNEKDPSPQGPFQHAAGSVAEDPSCCDYCRTYENVCNGIPGFWNEKEPSPQESPFMCFAQEAGEKQSMHPKSSSDGNEKADPGQSFVSNSRMFDETKVDNGVSLPNDKPNDKLGDGPEEFILRSTSNKGKSEGCSGKASNQDRVRADSNEASLSKTASSRTNIDQVESSFVEAKEPNDNRGVLDNQAGNATPSVEGNLINEREKLKDTDEYKRAIEEEWAARQRELQIQSEEAQRLRKRRKAENMRLCDIERRQKQRIEEVRQTQKKDEENINLKEQLRGEIRKEITKLEITCIDMASLLRGLGIQVGGGFSPMAHDVHAAYKRALLKFHPDRASKTDIRQQVEAEEKFKLISRMKEKFFSTSCY